MGDTGGEEGMRGRVGLRPLLLGAALSDRDDPDHTLAGLDSHLEGVRPLVRDVYGDSVAARQADDEMAQIVALPRGAPEVACKRAALLFALHKEPELKRYFAEQEGIVGASYAHDMATRVLPFVAPHFLKHSCQAPDAFVHACAVLAEMWPGERLGNWPLGGVV